VSGGRRLQSPPGSLARPTAARVRLAVINRLAPRMDGCRWLDLCCGSGAMACEALQHGAGSVVAVERDRRIAAVAQANLAAVATGRSDRPPVRVETAEVLQWLARGPAALGGSNDGAVPRFDLIYVDPPYDAGLYSPIAKAVAQGGWLAPDGQMVWECSSRNIPALPQGWQLQHHRRYGGSAVLYLEASAAQGAAATVLVPGGNEQPRQGDGDKTENDAAEERFDHGDGLGRGAPCNSSMMEGRPRAFPAQP
jgi:16S rRNA (guanine966-N2)-methyltransferase